MGSKKEDYHKPTILQVVPSMVAGGVERGTIEIAKAIIESGGEALVTSAGGPLVKMLDDCGARHMKMSVDTKNPLLMFWNIFKLAEIIQENDVDIIHARSRAPAWSAYFAAKKTGCPLITTFHGIYNFNESFKRQYNAIMTYGERVIAVSEFVKRHILENYNVDESKIRVIYRGVDTDLFDPKNATDNMLQELREKYHVPESVPVILLPARMTKWKGQEVLVKALNILKDKEFFCIIAGDLTKHPNFTERISKMIQQNKLQCKVRLFGSESNMTGLYALSDIVLSTSIEPEAFGRVIIEAQSMEKIVIASNIGGAAETVIDGENGFHIPPNDPVELADKISYVLDNINSAKLNKIRKNARKMVSKNFSIKSMKQKTLEVYREVI